MLNQPGPLTDADVALMDQAPAPMEDRDIALHDASHPVAPPDPRSIADQQYAAGRKILDRMYQGLAKKNKIASYGVPAGTLTDDQQVQYNTAAQQLETQRQAALSVAPPGPPPGAMPAMAEGGDVHQGPIPALVGEGVDAQGNQQPEVLQHSSGLPDELLIQPQVRMLGIGGTDRVVPLKRDEDRGRIRGSIDVPLSSEGRSEIQEMAQNMAQSGGLDELSSSGMQRTGETANIVAQAVGAPPPTIDPALQSWSLGALEGQPVSDAADRLIQQHVEEMPDAPIPGAGPESTQPGESFNSFKHRVLGAVHKALTRSAASPHRRIGIVTHNRDVKLTKGWVKAGARPDHSIDTREMGKAGDPPGAVHKLELGPGGKVSMRPFKPGREAATGGVYLLRHGRTSYNSPKERGS